MEPEFDDFQNADQNNQIQQQQTSTDSPLQNQSLLNASAQLQSQQQQEYQPSAVLNSETACNKNNNISNQNQTPPSLTIPIVFGNISFLLGKRVKDNNSHEWICFLRGLQMEDLSFLIQKVVFLLHPTFDEPVFTITKHPFELASLGWGEFEIIITIYFWDDSIKPIDIPHLLKLHPVQSNDKKQSNQYPVISEFYDEIVILNPTNLQEMQQKWQKAKDEANSEIMSQQLQMQYFQKEQQQVQGQEDKDSAIKQQAPQQSISLHQFRSLLMSPSDVAAQKKQDQLLLSDALAFINSEYQALQAKVNSLNQTYKELYSKHDALLNQ